MYNIKIFQLLRTKKHVFHAECRALLDIVVSVQNVDHLFETNCLISLETQFVMCRSRDSDVAILITNAQTFHFAALSNIFPPSA